MRGLVIHDQELSYRDDLPEPACPPGSVRIQVLQAGVCSTDLALVRGYMGFAGTPGHEFVGIALEGAHAGQRVVGEINAACGDCSWCGADLGRHCPDRSVLGILNHGGCFAEQIVLPEANLLPVPDVVSNDAATFTEPLAAAFEILEQLPELRDETALVIGDGRLGLLCARVLHDRGLAVTVSGHHPERQALLPPAVPIRERWVTATTAPQPFDLVVEATGNPAVLQTALPWVRPRGTLLLKTTSEATAPLDLALAVINEIQILGSRCGRFEPALAAFSATPDHGGYDPTAMIDARFPLADGVAALAHAAKPGVLKVIIEVAAK
ncbi:MAG: alcohol dehydrogenase catalytic domain-containing protein [Planctomycetota bacterium]